MVHLHPQKWFVLKECEWKKSKKLLLKTVTISVTYNIHLQLFSQVANNDFKEKYEPLLTSTLTFNHLGYIFEYLLLEPI